MLIDVIRIADIDETQLSDILLYFIGLQDYVFRDTENLEEHLYNPDLIWEQIDNWSRDDIKEEFSRLKEVCDTNECSYFRLIRR